jgi:hypothetical protein
MKKYLAILTTILIAGSVWAAPLQKTVKSTPSFAPSVTTNAPLAQLNHDLSYFNTLIVLPKPNEIEKGRFVYSGVAVQLVKVKQPWQWINPDAPAKYGYGDYNLDRDIITGRTVGFKIFSIGF